jgi:O-antigen ligase
MITTCFRIVSQPNFEMSVQGLEVPDGTVAAPETKPQPDARALLVFFMFLLFLIPARLVIGAMGAPGSPAALFSLGLLVWWCAGQIMSHDWNSPGRHPIRLLMMAFTLAALISYIMGALYGLPDLEASGADRGMLSVLGWVGLCLVACDMLKSRESIDRLLQVLTYLVTFVAVLGIIQFLTHFDISNYITIPGLTANGSLDTTADRSGFLRVSATTSHPIEFGVMVASVYPLALHYALDDPRAPKWLRWTVVVILTIAIPLAVSRSAVLGITVAMIVLLISWPSSRRWMALLVTPLILAAMRVTMPGLLGTLFSGFTHSDDSIKGRTDDYAVIGTYIDRSPFVGTGFGTFIPKTNIILDNQYLGSTVEMGYVGSGLLLLMMIVGFATARGVVRRAPDSSTRSLGVSLSASILVLGVTFATFDGLGFPIAAALLFLLLGVTGALWRVVGGPSQVQRLPNWMKRDEGSVRPAA